jgi:hypothetical protein
VNPHFAFLVIDTENACEFTLKGNDSAVKDTV